MKNWKKKNHHHLDCPNLCILCVKNPKIQSQFRKTKSPKKVTFRESKNVFYPISGGQKYYQTRKIEYRSKKMKFDHKMPIHSR